MGKIEEFELRYLDGRLIPVEEWPASKALWGEFVNNFEVCLHNALTGQEQPVSYSAFPVRDSQGETVLIVYLMQDPAERLRSVLALEKSRAELEAVLNSLAEGVAVFFRILGFQRNI